MSAETESAREDAEDARTALDQLARQAGELFHATMPAFESAVQLESTQARLRTHFVARDANGHVAIDMLAGEVADSVIDFCIPRKKIEAARTSDSWTRGATRLEREARELFVASETAGEGGELLLFLLMESVLQIPQILSKMPLKTNKRLHVNGSDGVHAHLLPNQALELVWAESKLYKDRTKAFENCFASLAPFLRADGDEDRRRDLQLVRDHLNISDANLTASVMRYFDDESPLQLKVKWRGACLIGFDQKDYPDPSSEDEEHLSSIRQLVETWGKLSSSGIIDNQIDGVEIDVFCLPVPAVAELRTAILNKLGVPLPTPPAPVSGNDAIAAEPVEPAAADME